MQNDNESTEGKAPQIDRLIHEPSRYNIMALLYVVHGADYLFLLNQTEMTSGNLTAHMAKLEEAGYVVVEKKFVGKRPNTFMRLTPEGRRAFENYRCGMNRLINRLPEVRSHKSDRESGD